MGRFVHSPYLPHVSGIYVILNTVAGHRYIGSTADLQRRRQSHFFRLSHQTHESKLLQQAFNLYGKESFIFIVLEYAESVDRIREREQYYMDTLSCEYNVFPAKDHTGYRYSEESKLKMRLAQKGKPKDPKHVAAMAAGHRGLKYKPRKSKQYPA